MRILKWSVCCMTQEAGASRYVESLSQSLQGRFTAVAVQYVKNARYADEDTIYVNHTSVLDIAKDLRKQFPYLLDVCGVDYPGRDQRFEVVYHFLNPDTRQRLRVKTKVNDGDEVPSLTPVYKAANWFEREA